MWACLAVFYVLIHLAGLFSGRARSLGWQYGVLFALVAVVATGLFFVWRCIRYIRWFKKRRGACCFRCSYPMRDTIVCPECGSTRDVGKLAAHWRRRCHDGFLHRRS